MDRQIAEDRQREETLQAYLDRMEYLILEKGLRSASTASEPSILARAFTTTALRELDGRRKGAVLLFLAEAGLLEKEKPILDLQNANFSLTVLFSPDLSGLSLRRVSFSGADLKKANLVDTDLSSAYLQNSILPGADLTGADLPGANLAGADLSGAIVSYEQLEQANSLKGAILPAGNRYDGELDK